MERWSDDNPFLDDYVATHDGAIQNSLWMQHDPKSMYLEQSNTWPYWRSLMRATAFSTAYSFQWKLGRLAKASMGITETTFSRIRARGTNETGWLSWSQLQLETALDLGRDRDRQACIRHLEL